MSHPYYPTALLLPGYVPPAIPFQQVLAYFFSACGVLFGLTWLLTGAYGRQYHLRLLKLTMRHLPRSPLRGPAKR